MRRLYVERQAEIRRRMSRPKRSIVERNREEAHARLYADYFSENPTWGADVFRRRFRMRKHLFDKVKDTLEAWEQYFQQRPDATGKMGPTVLQKRTIALWQLANGGATDQYDEYIRMGDSTVNGAILHRHCCGLLCIILEDTDGKWMHSPTLEAWRSTRFSGHAQKHRLHPLAMEKLSDGMEMSLHEREEGQSDNCARGCCFAWFMDLAFILRCSGLEQWYQCFKSIECVYQSSER